MPNHQYKLRTTQPRPETRTREAIGTTDAHFYVSARASSSPPRCHYGFPGHARAEPLETPRQRRVINVPHDRVTGCPRLGVRGGGQRARLDYRPGSTLKARSNRAVGQRVSRMAMGSASREPSSGSRQQPRDGRGPCDAAAATAIVASGIRDQDHDVTAAK
ncbi:hypothetical protein DL766_006253 [Monosporascus sp. MC13-8B]|uniref:Uncharacterized protein n=1 Tax=Monosporascus cannonballus TaxID=155416 RepID=A0ABY0GTD0_9PEZI|nr:hypothetical protein DL762_009440 [Monosporascus cannonballus]RYO84752.1 hypothetical protein DL763_007369 [Monosporascus cannonballus]RYP27704.1 hypothetical protein DL766_006253 [Monosporascus sp. MC13-8B]